MAFQFTCSKHIQFLHTDLVKLSNAVVIFVDIENSQTLVDDWGESKAYTCVHDLFSRLHTLSAYFGLNTVKTNGDQIIISQIHANNTSSVCNKAGTALAALNFANHAHTTACNIQSAPHSGLRLRIGIAQGDVFLCRPIQGMRYCDVWGKTVNTAAILEHHASPGSTALSIAAFNNLPKKHQRQFVDQTFDTKIGKVTAKIKETSISLSTNSSMVSPNLTTHVTLSTRIAHGVSGKLRPFNR